MLRQHIPVTAVGQAPLQAAVLVKMDDRVLQAITTAVTTTQQQHLVSVVYLSADRSDPVCATLQTQSGLSSQQHPVSC